VSQQVETFSCQALVATPDRRARRCHYAVTKWVGGWHEALHS
jgi:hypothetical protein